MPQTRAAKIHPEDTEPGEGAIAVKRYNRVDYEQTAQPQLRHRRALCVSQVEARMEK